MSKRLNRLEDYISSKEAAILLSQKFNRSIDPDYIRKIKGVRSHRANDRCVLYNRDDILAANVKQKQQS